ncbi:hypothetical protein CLV94_1254 [Flavobacterium endophyticum]|uniref:Uncharacterized protein n=1 Tax=Flavobacterium endophyticum TaxID=1540163 RepID=A0A495MJQ1_9FLAO|nr:hypothetical protein [Flavobacterium endophyticum]RKS26197.1 hypothetical protein CLV94_1254 [Flavobacterium endophyticum]
MYKTVFFKNNSEYYATDLLLFTVKRKRLLLGIRSICNVYKKEKLIFSFYTSEFTILYWKVKILSQSLEKTVIIKKQRLNYNLIVDGKSLSLKFANNPFKKTIGKLYLDENYIGKIQWDEKDSKTFFYFSFEENTGLEFYFLILFSIHSVGITDSP